MLFTCVLLYPWTLASVVARLQPINVVSMFVLDLSNSYMRLASKKNDPSRVDVLPSKHINHGCHSDSSLWYIMNLSYGHLHMPILCSHATILILRLASSMACRKSLLQPSGHGHRILTFSFTATGRYRAPSTTCWYTRSIWVGGHIL